MFFGPEQQGPMMVTIQDPVAGFQYTLDSQSRVAHRAELRQGNRQGGIGGGGGVIGGQIGGLMASRGIAVAPSATTAGTTGLARRVESSTESLGTQILEGVEVVGRRFTHTIPEGAQGNDRPMTSIQETWTSPTLKVTVLSKNTDPRSGESTMKLTDIVASEPDPALFQPPADYTVVDEKEPFTISHSVP
jgi:hypothetical protein